MGNVKKCKLSWRDIEKLSADMVNIVQKNTKVNYVAGIPRGGLIPAVIISHTFRIPFLDFKEALKLNQPDILLVDDIADSGSTVKKYRVTNLTIGTLMLRHDCPHKPDYWGKIMPNDQWLVYPWENIDAPPIQDYLR